MDRYIKQLKLNKIGLKGQAKIEKINNNAKKTLYILFSSWIDPPINEKGIDEIANG